VINITGEMDNAGATFLSSSIGPVRLDGGRISGGSINTTAAAPLEFTSNSNNRLSGVAVDGTLEFSGFNSRVLLENGTTLTGTVNMTDNSVLGIIQTGTLAGPLTVNMDSDVFFKGTAYLNVEGENSVTFGSGVTCVGRGRLAGSSRWAGPMPDQ
jgi:hypothetical protein